MVEGGFATIYYHVRSIMAHGGLHDNLNTDLWPESMSSVTKLENIIVNLYEETCVYEKFYGKIPDYAKCLNNFVSVGVLRSTAIIKSKIEDQGMT